MSKKAIAKEIIEFIKDPADILQFLMIGKKFVEFVKDNTLLTIALCGVLILITIIAVYLFEYVSEKFKI